MSEPSLVTSLRLSDENAGNGFITSQEIMDFKLDADLVVLSACNTGSSKTLSGESLSGLVRAFFFSGARSMVVSHWKVDDEATKDLIVNFFKKLKTEREITLSQAMREAKKEIMDNPRKPEWRHPFYWAAFSIVGDGSRVVTGL